MNRYGKRDILGNFDYNFIREHGWESPNVLIANADGETTGVDWNKVPEGYDWIAVDADMEIYGYKNEPVISPYGEYSWLKVNNTTLLGVWNGELPGGWKCSVKHRLCGR